MCLVHNRHHDHHPPQKVKDAMHQINLHFIIVVIRQLLLLHYSRRRQRWAMMTMMIMPVAPHRHFQFQSDDDDPSLALLCTSTSATPVCSSLFPFSLRLWANNSSSSKFQSLKNSADEEHRIFGELTLVLEWIEKVLLFILLGCIALYSRIQSTPVHFEWT